jgi:hypothetical protein
MQKASLRTLFPFTLIQKSHVKNSGCLEVIAEVEFVAVKPR